MGDRTRAPRGDPEERNIAEAWSGDSGSLQRLTGRNVTFGTPGARPRAATCETDQQKWTDSPLSQHFDR